MNVNGFFVLGFLLSCPNGNFPCEIRVAFPGGKPAATESRYPTLLNYKPYNFFIIVYAVFLCDHEKQYSRSRRVVMVIVLRSSVAEVGE